MRRPVDTRAPKAPRVVLGTATGWSGKLWTKAKAMSDPVAGAVRLFKKTGGQFAAATGDHCVLPGCGKPLRRNNGLQRLLYCPPCRPGRHNTRWIVGRSAV